MQAQKQFFERKLTIFALVLYISAMFLPWISEYFWQMNLHGRYYNWLFWSFMAKFDYDYLLFGSIFRYNIRTREFFVYLSVYLRRPILFFGLYFGWVLIFTCQILTIILWFNHRFRLGVPLKEWHAFGVVGLPVMTLILAVYQRLIQEEMIYRTMWDEYSVDFRLGFWIAAASTVLLLISYARAPEREQIKRFKTLVKRSFRMVGPTIIPICIMGFFLVNELYFETGVTKLMYVEKKVKAEDVLGDPKFWENHLDKIVAVASLFRARVVYSKSDYFFCEIEVPIISYRILMTIYNRMGYIAREPIFARIL